MSKQKTCLIKREFVFGIAIKVINVYYRGEAVLTYFNELSEAQNEAMKLGFTHAKYEGIFSGKVQPRNGKLLPETNKA